MTESTAAKVYDEIVSITNFLVETSLVDRQNYPRKKQVSDGGVVIDFPSALPTSSMIKDQNYSEMYLQQVKASSFNFYMLDGALIQMQYEFWGKRKGLHKARLAFLPSPDLSEFQNNPEIYIEDVVFAEVVDKRVVAVPVRFDFDNTDGVARSVVHPRSHLTLGQYKNCRIAASRPLSPGVFVDFILRSFYNTAAMELSKGVPRENHRFLETVTPEEVNLVHVAIP
jgi:hypothetical protein